jgi:hypothetical protein
MEAAAIGVKAPQHMQALAKANRVRLARAEMKRAIARGELSVPDVLRAAPEEMEGIPLDELLRSQKRWGRTRARKFLLGLAIHEKKKLGTLTTRQRRLLADELEGNHDSAKIILSPRFR